MATNIFKRLEEFYNKNHAADGRFDSGDAGTSGASSAAVKESRAGVKALNGVDGEYGTWESDATGDSASYGSDNFLRVESDGKITAGWSAGDQSGINTKKWKAKEGADWIDSALGDPEGRDAGDWNGNHGSEGDIPTPTPSVQKGKVKPVDIKDWQKKERAATNPRNRKGVTYLSVRNGISTVVDAEEFYNKDHSTATGQFDTGSDGPGRVRDDVTKANTAGGKAPKGLVKVGNIKIHERPIVKNSDGTMSTVRSISIGTDEGEVLIPTVVGGKVVSNDEAIAHYKSSGEQLGIFDNEDDANAYAETLHEEQDVEYGNKDMQQQLNAMGTTPPLAVDGVIGPKTKAAIMALQTSLGVKADGIWGPKTAAALKKNGNVDLKGAAKSGAKPAPAKPVAKTSGPTPKPKEVNNGGGPGPGGYGVSSADKKQLETGDAWIATNKKKG